MVKMRKKSHIPAKQELSDNKIVRTFSSDVKTEELKWHWDAKDRIITVLNENDWMIQFDDELPKKLCKNDTIEIKAGVWHRAIKGSTELIVSIQES